MTVFPFFISKILPFYFHFHFSSLIWNVFKLAPFIINANFDENCNKTASSNIHETFRTPLKENSSLGDYLKAKLHCNHLNLVHTQNSNGIVFIRQGMLLLLNSKHLLYNEIGLLKSNMVARSKSCKVATYKETLCYCAL